MNKAIIYIEETNSMADVTFPSVPRVVSLLRYDDPGRTRDNLPPSAGYPVVCVTVRQSPVTSATLLKSPFGVGKAPVRGLINCGFNCLICQVK